jgi:zinc protease
MKSRLLAAASAAALLIAAPAFAEGTSAAPPAAATAGIEVPPLGFTKRTLPNGLKVYTARDTSTSNVTVQVWYRVGSKDDPRTARASPTCSNT